MVDLVQLCDLYETDLFDAITRNVDADALYAFSLTCRAARGAVRARLRGARPRTTRRSVVINTRLLEWACANGCRLDALTCAVAAKALGNHLEVLRWAHANGCTCQITTALKLKCAHGAMVRPDVIDWVATHLH